MVIAVVAVTVVIGVLHHVMCRRGVMDVAIMVTVMVRRS